MIKGEIGDNRFFFMVIVMIRKASDTNSDERSIPRGMVI